MKFRSNAPKLPPEAAKRQGRVATSAFVALGSRDAALAFLNEPNSDLGGRPIDIAVASDEGAERVLEAIARLGAARATGG